MRQLYETKDREVRREAGIRRITRLYFYESTVAGEGGTDGARPITRVISEDLYERADHWTGAQQETGDKVGYTNEKERFERRCSADAGRQVCYGNRRIVATLRKALKGSF